MPATPFLIPGYGAQGGSAAEIRPAFDPQGLGGVVNSSRNVIFAYRLPTYQALATERGWEAAWKRQPGISQQLSLSAEGSDQESPTPDVKTEVGTGTPDAGCSPSEQ